MVFMKASSGLSGYGNAQCISDVHHKSLGTISLYGHNQHYKTYDIDRIIDRLKEEEYCENCEQLQADLDKIRKCLPIKYKEGFIAGLQEYAWWKDGVQQVGTCGTTLKEAIEQVL